jgi:flagellin-like hook-associated protein FlgL
MVAISGSTQYARILDQTRLIRNLNLELTQQQQQLSSGRIIGGMVGVSERGLELADLKAELESTNAYKNGITSAQNRVRLYGITMEQLIDVATEAQDLMIKNRDSFFASTSAPTAQINVLMDRVGTLLQVKDADRYIFSGRNYSLNPINSPLSQVVADSGAGAVPAAFTPSNEGNGVGGQQLWLNVATADQLDNYYLDAAGTNGAAEANLISVFADDSERVEYGITATDPGIQQLVEAMGRFRSAIQDIATPTTFTARVDDALAALRTSLQNLKVTASTNGHTEQRLKELQARHDRSQDVLKTRIGGIEDADPAETATLIKALQTSLEATYTITRDTLQLSLVNFLK